MQRKFRLTIYAGRLGDFPSLRRGSHAGYEFRSGRRIFGHAEHVQLFARNESKNEMEVALRRSVIAFRVFRIDTCLD